MLHPTRTTENRKRPVSCKKKTKQRRKKQYDRKWEWKWEDKRKPMTKKKSTLEAEVFVNLDHGSKSFEIFPMVTGMNELLEIIVTK